MKNTPSDSDSLVEDDPSLPEMLSPVESPSTGAYGTHTESTQFQVFDTNEVFLGFATQAGFKVVPKTQESIALLTRHFNDWLKSKL
jgi:hypothetical protein